MVKDHSDSERGNPLPPHGLLFPINRKGSFICTYHRQDSTYHSLCYTSRGALAGTRNSSMGPPHEGSIRRPIAPWGNALTTELHLAPCVKDSRSDVKLNDLFWVCFYLGYSTSSWQRWDGRLNWGWRIPWKKDTPSAMRLVNEQRG